MSIIDHSDLDIYLLNFLDIESILTLSLVSKTEHNLLTSNKFFIDLFHIVKKETLTEFLKNPIDLVCKYGSTIVLEWFKNSNYEFKSDEKAIDWASKNGHTNVLEW